MLIGDMQALSRLITLVENESPDVSQIMKTIYPHMGNSCCIGITGAPGAGKSTIVDKLTGRLRRKEFTVGILCADPSSPFSGGALLGDRIRMQEHYLDDNVFIRSMSTRGNQGGLPQTISNAIKLLKAFHKDFIITETVGVGQTELEIMHNSDTILVVLTPESGDAIQLMKAGILEIADIFIVNKSERAGAEQMLHNLRQLSEESKEDNWQTPVIAAQATNDTGIDELFEVIEKHRHMLNETGLLAQRRRDQRRDELQVVIESRLRDKLKKLATHDLEMQRYITEVENANLDPYTAADEILRSIIGIKNPDRQ